MNKKRKRKKNQTNKNTTFCFYMNIFISHAKLTGDIFLVDTGDETKLHEIKKTITDNPTCESKWGVGNILDTHICLGNGDKGACNVSWKYYTKE